jgi:hypothetical protein
MRCATAERNGAQATSFRQEGHLSIMDLRSMKFAPALPLVAYDSGAALARSRKLGFAEIGPLRIRRTVHA